MIEKKAIAKTLDKRFDNSIDLSFTICPDNDGQHRGHVVDRRWLNVVATVSSFLEKYDQYIEDYTLYPDLSFPNPLGERFPRIHFHGTIRFKDVVGFLTVVSCGWMLIEIDTISDKKIWDAYCKKFVAKFPEYAIHTINKNKQLATSEGSNNKPKIQDFLIASDSDEEDAVPVIAEKKKKKGQKKKKKTRANNILE